MKAVAVAFSMPWLQDEVQGEAGGEKADTGWLTGFRGELY